MIISSFMVVAVYIIIYLMRANKTILFFFNNISPRQMISTHTIHIKLNKKELINMICDYLRFCYSFFLTNASRLPLFVTNIENRKFHVFSIGAIKCLSFRYSIPSNCMNGKNSFLSCTSTD